jgi:drug/metabolite transporter, DME family
MPGTRPPFRSLQTHRTVVAPRGGPWLVLAAAVLWGTTGTAQALAPAGTPPAAVGAVRLAVGGVALLVLAAGRGALCGGQRWPAGVTALAAGSMAAYQPFFFAAVARTGVAVGTVVAIGSAPILAGMLAFLVRRERLQRTWLPATALAVGGCTLLIGAGDSMSVDALGVVLALGAGLAYAIYAVSSKGLLEDRPPDAVMAVVFCLGALALSPLLFVVDLRWLMQLRGLAVALHLGVVATAIAYALFARGLRAVPVATAVTLSLAEPLTATALGVILLGERLTAPATLGSGLLLGGLALLALETRSMPISPGPG